MNTKIHNYSSKSFANVFKPLALLCVCVCSAFWGNNLIAQQDPQYSQYMFNQLAINPAYAGSKECLSVATFVRSQWVGFGNGAPNTQTVTMHSPLRKKKVAVGFTIIADEVGPKRSIGALGSYAYRIRLGSGKLSLGLRGGIYQYIFDWNKINYKDPTDQAAGKNSTTTYAPTADAGAYYYTSSMYVGLSAAHLFYGHLKSVFNQNGDYVQLSSHLFFTAGKAWEINDKLIFSPSCMVKYVQNTPASVDLNVSFLIQKRLWAGVSVRTMSGVVAYTQFYITDKFKFGYALDLGVNKVGKVGGASHEFMLSYDLKVGKTPFFSPRYF
jgi:type IX secretion system PorP/SprF family membrane protein